MGIYSFNCYTKSGYANWSTVFLFKDFVKNTKIFNNIKLRLIGLNEIVARRVERSEDLVEAHQS